MFQEIQEESFDQRELRILDFWEKNKIFEQSVDNRKKEPTFSFYDGPPFATGLPHYGHLLAGTIKDVLLRFKTMEGFYVPRRFGWDCHGLPVESEIEKMHQLSGKVAIEAFGIDRFNEACREIVLRYTKEWKGVVSRMGRWVDFSKTYRTMDVSFMESVWWVFKQLYQKGLIYEGYKVMPYSAKLGTALSNFEAGENYKDVDDPSLTVAFPLEGKEEVFLLIWTTTPWTLISNLAVLAGPDIEYVQIKDLKLGKQFILAKNNLKNYYKDETLFEVIKTFPGKTLRGLKYTPPFSYFIQEKKQGAFQVILEESVSVEEGTGLVHAAPAFGEVDFYACQREKISLVCPVDQNGCFTKEIPEYTGLFVKEADKDIIKRLKQAGKVIQHTVCRHRYPFCGRSDTPLIYKAVSTWFVAVEKIKEELLKANHQVHWTPGHIKEGRFGKWLEGARDWAISRSRYWGTPIPLWRALDGEILVLGSLEELESLTGKTFTDLHRHFIDDCPIIKEGKAFYRVKEVFDCWFESGSMPYAQLHYPFENQQAFEQGFPADFIAEGLDQTRGWFYTLTILSCALFDKPAFKNVIVNGIILAEDGAKMSKRLKNYPDPSVVIREYGADAIRLYLLSSPAVKGEDLRFSKSGVELVLRQVLIPFWNAYSFFITYARIYDWKPKKPFSVPEAKIDRWILSILQKLLLDVKEGLDDYDLNRAVLPLVGFVDQLTNWYIRRSRRRFWSDEPSKDRDLAFQTLYLVLMQFCEIAAPFIPFIADAIYLNLRTEEMPKSVHLCRFPRPYLENRDLILEETMLWVQKAVSLGHSLRKEQNLKVRQPLLAAYVALGNVEILEMLKKEKHLIEEELNVKEVHFVADETQFVHLQAKPNFPVLGKKVGNKMRAIQAKIGALTQQELNILMEGHSLTLSLEGGESQVIFPEDVMVSREVQPGVIAANHDFLTIALDLTLTEPLLKEGIAREMINKINTMRREAKFDVQDRISLVLETTPRVELVFNEYKKMICGEVLAVSVTFSSCQGVVWDLNGESTKIKIEKVSSYL